MNVMIMATIMGKQRASDACTLFHLDKPQMGSQPRRLSSLASAVNTLGCRSQVSHHLAPSLVQDLLSQSQPYRFRPASLWSG